MGMLIAMLLAPGASARVFEDVPFTHWAYQAIDCIERVVDPTSPRSLVCPLPSTRYEVAVFTIRAGDQIGRAHV